MVAFITLLRRFNDFLFYCHIYYSYIHYLLQFKRAVLLRNLWLDELIIDVEA